MKKILTLSLILFLLLFSEYAQAQELIAAKKNDKWGYIDRRGNTVIPFVHEEATPFNEGGDASVKMNGKWGRINKKGKIIIRYQYDNAPYWYGGLAVAASGNKWGVVDSLGKEVIPLSLDTIINRYYTKNLFIGKKDGKFCLYNKGEMLLPPEYEDIQIDYYTDNYVIARKDGKYGLVNLEGETVIPFLYEGISEWRKGIYRLKTKNKDKYFNINTGITISQHEYYAPAPYSGYVVKSEPDCDIYVNQNGENVFDKRFHTARKFRDGFAMVTDFDLSRYCIDTLGNIRFKLPPDTYIEPFSDKYLTLREKGKRKSGIIDTRGKVILNPDFRFIIKSHNYFRAYTDGNVFEFYNARGEQVSGPYSETNYIFRNGLKAVKRGDKWGFVDTAHIEVAKPVYDKFILHYGDNIHTVVCIDNKWGVIDKTGREVIPLKYDSIAEDYAAIFANGFARVSINGKWGYIDSTQKEITPILYDSCSSFSPDGMALVRLKNKWGYIDRWGKTVIPCIYDEVNLFKKDMAIVKYKGKYGVIDRKNRLLIPFLFDAIEEWRFYDHGAIEIAELMEQKVIIEEKDDDDEPDRIYK